MALASGIADIIKSAMAKNSVLQDLEAALPDLLAAGQGVSNVGVDIKSASNQAYVLWAIAQCFEAP